MMQVRALSTRDMEAVAAITKASPETTQWSEVDFEDTLSAGGTAKCLVAEQDGRVIGFVCYLIAADEAEILNVAVVPDARRRGCATRLMLEATRKCSAGGVNLFFLEVRKDNATAVTFYEQQGFERAGERRVYYSNPSGDAVVMARKVVI